MSKKLTTMAQDYKESINWIFDSYKSKGVELDDGFQKDAIQNSVGARSKNQWNQWKCMISLKETEKGSFLIIEDEGTEGLSGPNISRDEIQKLIADKETNIDSTWRLARFSSRNVSGGNEIGPGKYGVGKSVYAASSNDYDYYFDSYRKDGLYVANRVNGLGEIYEKAFENNDAINFIKEFTGLLAKRTVGTRVIIANPRDEIVESIKNGSMINYIQESWWRCIEKMPKDSGIYVNGEKVEVPKMPKFEYEYFMENPELYAKGYRVKKFGFCILKKNDPFPWRGISYYRRGMKIGQVDLKDLPATIKDKYWGYIEVDTEWETKLADIEDSIHYGIQPNKSRTTTYQNLKLYIEKKVSKLLVEWGYIKDKEHEDQKLRETLKEISSELQDLFDREGFEDLGKGPKKPDFTVRWKDINYPVVGSETVTTGDKIGYGFRISNDYLTDKKFTYSIDVISKSDEPKKTHIEKGSLKINAGQFNDQLFEYEVSKDTAERYEENRLVLTIGVSGSTKEKRKELSFFYDTEKEVQTKQIVTLSLHSISFPRENSRRIDFGEKLGNISYLIDNSRNFPLEFRLSLSLHRIDEKASPKIKDLGNYDGSVGPFEEILIDGIPDVEMIEAELSPYIDAGLVELRARLIAMSESDEYEKGDKITQYYQKLYLNKDDKNGKEGSFEPLSDNDPNRFERSWCKAGNRTITINIGHPAYLAAQENDAELRGYIKQEMLKQYVMLYIEEGRYEMFGEGKDITKMEPIEAGIEIMKKIEEIYRKSFD